MSIKETLSFIETIEESQSMPSFVLTLMARINNPNSSEAEIEKLIKIDPVLVAYIKRFGNSFVFGLKEEITSHAGAIKLLGMTNLRLIFTSYSLRLLCQGMKNAHARGYIWHHSISTAVMSKIIAEKVYGREQPDAYVFGLMHDIGKIVLYLHNTVKFQKSLEAGIMSGMDFVKTERLAFGFSHIEAGYFMAGKLGFSKKMKDIILFHHNPEFGPAGDKMHWIVGLSNELAHYINDNKPVDLRRYLDQISLTNKTLQEIMQNIQNHIKKYKGLL